MYQDRKSVGNFYGVTVFIVRWRVPCQLFKYKRIGVVCLDHSFLGTASMYCEPLIC